MNALIRAEEAMQILNIKRSKFYELQASGVITYGLRTPGVARVPWTIED
jgi:predicted DNA-binding transcriptional regulator AlpA